MNLVVVGMGYVGIPVAALFADVPGIKVTGIQRRSVRSTYKIDLLNQGISPIEGDEPGLAELIKRVVDQGTFIVTDDVSAYKDADAIIVAVQTSVDENHLPQYDSLKIAVTDIGENMKHGVLICLESTVAPGTTNYLVKPLLEERSKLRVGRDFNLVFSYERVMVGRLLYNLTHYDRIIGGITHECTQRGIELYKNIVRANLHPTDALTAEVAKVTENAYRDVNIAFANEIALICESLGVNVHDVRKFVNNLPDDPSTPHTNPHRNMHIPGAGVGGHCLPKDSWLLKYGLDSHGFFMYTPSILIESRRINEGIPRHMKELALEALNERGVQLKDAHIAILGLAFIENSDDTRNTPAEPLYNSLRGSCKELIVHDPYIKSYEDFTITESLQTALSNKDCVIIVTRHREYTSLTPDFLVKNLRTPIIIDGRNTLDSWVFKKAGFTFKGVGLPRI